MAVYTDISRAQLEALLEDYALGRLVSFEGIEGGIENSNFFVTLDLDGHEQQYVLTLFEELAFDEMPFFVELGQWLHTRQVPVPYAIKDRNGIALKQVCAKPAFFQPRFQGHHVSREQLTAAHCTEIGHSTGTVPPGRRRVLSAQTGSEGRFLVATRESGHSPSAQTGRC